MPTYPFLSDEWFAAVEALVAEEGVVPPEEAALVVNATVTGATGGDRDLHVGARDGRLLCGVGHVDAADLTIVTDHATARELFLGGDPQAVMQAFLLGKLVVSGDLGKLVERVQASGPGSGALPVPAALAERLLAVTA